MAFRILALLLLCCAPLSSYDAFAAQAENTLTNERPVLTGEELEGHWKLSCKQILEELFLQFDIFFNEKGPTKYANGEYKSILDTLTKCGHIYNTAGTSRTIACPNYIGATELLVFASINDVSPSQLKHSLSELLTCQ